MTKNPDKLKRKNLSDSAKAATVTVAIHAGLFLLAASLVAVHYVTKLNAEFVVTESAPKLERRQLQMPAKLEKIRQTNRRPKIVSRRVSSASPKFVAPDLGDIGSLNTQKFNMPFARSGRDFSSLTRTVGTSAPKIRFFDIRTEGEKLVFIVDASAEMLKEETGGTAAVEAIKQEVYRTLDSLPASVLFDVVLHDGETVKLFRPRMISATDPNRTAFKEWLEPVLTDPSNPGLAEDENNYTPPEVYETAMGEEASGWLLSLQAALEMRPDSVFIVGPGWGQHRISRDKGQRLLDFSLWELFSGGGAFSVAGAPSLREDRELRDDLLKQAVEVIVDEEEEMDSNGDVQKFLRDLLDYIQYSEKQVLDHAAAVVQKQYEPFSLAPPRVHFVRLVSEEDVGVSDSETTNLKELVRRFAGEMDFFNGSDVAQSRRSRGEVASSDETTVPEIPESEFNYFGVNGEGSRVAFLLELSDEMLAEEVGGTNVYAFIKDQLTKTVSALNPESYFNVFVYNGQKIAQYRPEMVLATNRAGVAEWLSPIGEAGNPELGDDAADYVAGQLYDTAVGADARGLTLALQAAMEQQADFVTVVSSGLGRNPVAREKARRLLDFSIWDALGGSSGTAGTAGTAGSEDTEVVEVDEEGNETTSTVDGEEGVAGTAGTAAVKGNQLRALVNDRRQRTQLIRRAIMRINEELDERKNKDLPLGFVHDMLDYVDYLPAQLKEHLEVVGKTSYGIDDEEEPEGLPEVHIVCLVKPGEKVSRVAQRDFREILDFFSGELKILQGGETEKDIRRANRLLELQP